MTDTNHKWLVPILSAGNFAIGMGAFVVIGMLNPLADGLGVGPAEAGWIMTVYAITYVIGSPLAVALTGAWGRRLVLVLGMTLFAVAALVSALSTSMLPLLFARTIAALGAGLFTPIAAAVAVTIARPEQRGKSLAAVFFGLTLSQVLGIPTGSYIAYTFGWQSTFMIVFVLALLTAIAVWRIVPARLEIVPASLGSLAATLLDWRAMLNVLYTGTLLAAIYIVYAYLAPLMKETMGHGRDELTLILLIFGFGAVAGNLAGGYLADKIGAVATLVLVSTVQMISMPFFTLLPFNEFLLFILVFTWSIFGWLFMAPQQSRLITFSPERQGILLSLNAAAIYVGVSVGTAIGGIVIEIWGVSAVGIAGGLGGLVALIHLLSSVKLAGPR